MVNHYSNNIQILWQARVSYLPRSQRKQKKKRSSCFNLKVSDRDSVFPGGLAGADGTFIAIEFDFAENDKYSRARARNRGSAEAPWNFSSKHCARARVYAAAHVQLDFSRQWVGMNDLQALKCMNERAGAIGRGRLSLQSRPAPVPQIYGLKAFRCIYSVA